MSNSYFRFKRFIVHQDKCAMKVGTDGVLLGAWSKVDKAKRILDVGTGTGLVALMLAQRSEGDITAIEIDKNATIQAIENVAISPWKERIKVLQMDYLQYNPDCKFDVIVSNPPYFVNSLLSPDDGRNKARHDNELNYQDLLKHSAPLLSDLGKLIIIIPMDVCGNIKSIASSVGLFPSNQLDIITVPGKLPKRCILEFGFIDMPCNRSTLLIEEKRHVYSTEFITLLKDYYLNM